MKLTKTSKLGSLNLFILLAVLVFLASCALWKNLTPVQKYDAAHTYYTVFATGLKEASVLLPTKYQAPVAAAILVADSAVDKLGQMVRERASMEELAEANAKAAASVETANAAVGASIVESKEKEGTVL